MKGQVPIPQDANLQLFDAANKAVAGDLVSDVVDLGVGFATDTPLPVSVILDVTTLTTAVEDETYTVALAESSDGETYTATGLSFALAAADLLDVVHKITGVTKRYLKATVTVVGAAPEIVLDGWINRA
jgi:hypothetical protein